jgi:carboxylesterase
MSVEFQISFKKSCKINSAEQPYENGLYLEGNNGCIVILIHGLTGTPNEMKFLANSLNKKGYSVICPRLANHGEPIEILKNTKWQSFYQSVKTAFTQANSSDKIIFTAGLSMGALLALLLAEEFKDRIAGVSCLSPTLFYDGWNTPWYKCFLPIVSHTPLKYFFYFKEDPPYGIKNEQVRERLHRFYSQARLCDTEGIAQYGYPYFPVTLLHQLHLLVRDLSKRLRRINTPVQLIQAKEDDVTSVKNSLFIYDRVKSDNKELVLLENSYHLITADYERDKVAQKVEEFFSKIYSNLQH